MLTIRHMVIFSQKFYIFSLKFFFSFSVWSWVSSCFCLLISFVSLLDDKAGNHSLHCFSGDCLLQEGIQVGPFTHLYTQTISLFLFFIFNSETLFF